MSAYTSRSLHIALDGFNLSLPRGTGVATYARTLSYALKEMSSQIDILYGLNISSGTSTDLQEVFFYERMGDEEPQKKTFFMSERWKQRQKSILAGCKAQIISPNRLVDSRAFKERMPAHDRILNARDLFLAASRRYRSRGQFMTVDLPDPPDVMHWTYPFPIRVRGARNVYTIHDLVPLQLPHTTRDDKGYYSRLIRDLSQNADAICTVSEASKNNIISFSPSAESIIYNTYQTTSIPDECIKQNSDENRNMIENVYGLQHRGYYIFYGSLEPKKNIGRIIESVLSSPTSRPLVIVGAMAWKSDGELRLLDNGIKSGRIIRMEYLPQHALMTLVRGARALLFPSLAEGFGLPVVEAMTLGTPVLTSCEGALLEVGGNAVMTVDPYNIPQITGAIARLDKDDDLCEELSNRGIVQAEKFNMNSYKQRLEEFYKKVMQVGIRDK